MTNSADPGQPTDLDLHCLPRQGISRFSRQGLIEVNFPLFDFKGKLKYGFLMEVDA